jgi:hypothetical protein
MPLLTKCHRIGFEGEWPEIACFLMGFCEHLNGFVKILKIAFMAELFAIQYFGSFLGCIDPVKSRHV